MKLVPFELLWLIPVLPLLGAIYCAVLGPRIQRRFGERAVHLPAVLLPWGSFVLTAWAFVTLAGSDRQAAMYFKAWGWLHVGWLDADVAFLMDRLSAVMTLVVTFVGSLIHIYATGYMKGDPGHWRFFSYLNLFMFSMLTLVLADNFLLMFVGWEGVGLCSYLLISFWYKEKANAVAGMKAFVVNRVGDAGFVLGLFLVFWGVAGTWTPRVTDETAPTPLADTETPGAAAAGPGASGPAARAALPPTSVKFREVERILKDPARRQAFTGQRWLGMSILTLACLLLFFGATGKSAQIPLYVWLPDAMAGPTPVSALIHAATMVTAGVYLVARLHFLFALSATAMTVVATVGAITALFAATIGLFQHDIKKVLAYSTVSQLGFMFVAVGVGAYWVGIFHLMTHAFFKACLFLGSGSVILGCHHEQDMRKMGGLRALMPVTAITYAISCFAIAGFPFFSGFFSKDEILWKVFNTGNLTYGSGGLVLWILAASAALCTSFYMFRSYYMTFSGTYRGAAGHDAHDAHDAHGGHGSLPKPSPASMNVVLIILAFFAVAAGLLGVPHLFKLPVPTLLQQWLAPVFASSEALIRTRGFGAGTEWTLMAGSVVIAFVGFLVARWLYLGLANPIPGRLIESTNPLVRGVHRLIYNKYYVDEVYGRVFVDGSVKGAQGLFWVDLYLVDGMVNLAGTIGRFFGEIQGWIDRTFVDGLVNLVADGILAAGNRLRALQTGRVQTYVYGIVVGCVLLTLAAYVVPW